MMQYFILLVYQILRILKKLTLLAIESSCDDTSVAILQAGKVLSNCVASQDAHRIYGGVVPELASRAHLENIIPTVSLALQKAGISKQDLDAIAVTRGPGLLGSLIVGVTFAKSLALALKLPLIEVNHMQAHVLAHFAEPPYPSFPFLCLTVSGGHTQIVLVQDHLEMEVLGSTIDDAAGEAFDKTGKLLGLDYPAGPIIDKLAKQGQARFTFTKPKVGELEFSFSGLKTNILQFLKKEVAKNPDFVKENVKDICASVQHTIVDILMEKLEIAARKHNITEVAIAGGVSANSGLRNALETKGAELGWNTYIPAFQFCTDNAAMIAVAAKYKYQKGEFSDQGMKPITRWAI